jgi:hypothetical protein
MNVVGRLRQPEYTGENRCVPCTVTNLVIAAVVSAAVGYAWFAAAGAGWWVVGLAVFVVSAASIWLRGYLVPGTPELTKRYFPDWLLASFDKGPRANAGMAATEADADVAAEASEAAGVDLESFDPETALLEGRVVEPCEHEDDLCLDDGFREAWRGRMAAIRGEDDQREALARQLDLDAETMTFQEHANGFVAFHKGSRVGQWESRPALVADLAAAREFSEWLADWDDLPVAARSQLLGGLRIFLDACPVCEGPVLAGTEVVESCCRSHEVVASSCEDCDARLLEVPYDEEAAA